MKAALQDRSYGDASADEGAVPVLTLDPGHSNALGRVDGDTLTVPFRGRELLFARSEGVLFPTDVGLSLLKALDQDRSVALQGRRVLDVGCGSGLYTVAALADGAARVTSLDVNATCLETTLAAVAANGLHTGLVDPAAADLRTWPAEAGPWDVVLANPPHFPADPSYAEGSGLHAALIGGADGRELYDVIVSRAAQLVAAGGVLVLAHSSLTGVGRTVRELAAAGFTCRTTLVTQLDMPLLRFSDDRDRLLARLYELRREGSALFCGLRFEVHVLIAHKTEGIGQ